MTKNVFRSDLLDAAERRNRLLQKGAKGEWIAALSFCFASAGNSGLRPVTGDVVSALCADSFEPQARRSND